ncbi:MAG: hypothetical protein CL726_11315 [Chloroflexi bacterium]|nr:hypothetical protein [Chloroflexota bacterium]
MESRRRWVDSEVISVSRSKVSRTLFVVQTDPEWNCADNRTAPSSDIPGSVLGQGEDHEIGAELERSLASQRFGSRPGITDVEVREDDSDAPPVYQLLQGGQLPESHLAQGAGGRGWGCARSQAPGSNADAAAF